MVTRERLDEELSDTTLVSRMAAGDERALGECYDRHGQVAFGLALAITGCEEAAEQVVASAFSDLWQNARTYREGRLAIRAVVTTVVRRQALSMRRTETRKEERVVDRRRVVEPAGQRHASSGESRTDQSRDVVLGVLNGLPAAQRRVLELAYFGGLPIREIATETHATEQDVTVQLRLAMEALRRSLSLVATPPPDPAITHA